jgi:mRNA-degrading endonuclease toxin of MazEF toxin-antitoxin module
MDLVDSIWLVDFGPNFPAEPGHKRPALIVGPTDGFADFLSNVFVVPFTTKQRGLNPVSTRAFQKSVTPNANN